MTTPVMRFLLRWLPARLAPVALWMVYAVMLLAIALFFRLEDFAIPYIQCPKAVFRRGDQRA